MPLPARPPRLRVAALLGCALACGCYTGLGARGSGDDAVGSDDDGTAGDDGGANDDGGTGVPGCGHGSVGPSGMQRLTSIEYDNTVADLLGLESHAVDVLPQDGRSGLFANNGAVTVSEYGVELYRGLAEDLAARAVADLDAIVTCAATDQHRGCADGFVRSFARRAYRRDLFDDDVARLMAVYDAGAGEGDLAAGLALVIETVLQSPYFLYRVEGGIPAPGDEVVELDGFEIATRLAYFLWKSMPDEALLDAAAAGLLDTPEGIAAQARRMLADDRAGRGIRAFVTDLYDLASVATQYKDPELYPDFTPELGADMRTELELFAISVWQRGEGGPDGMLTATHSFVNPRLAAYYGIEAPDPEGFARVELDPTRTRGLLTKPALLTKTAHDVLTSPVLRGKLVRERVLCQGLPPPPADVPPQPAAEPGQSNADVAEQHMNKPGCVDCHRLMDPIGLAFENYDAIGRWREHDNGVAVDASGELLATDVDGSFVGVAGLVDRLRTSEQVQQCVAAQWFEFGLGRRLGDDDSCSADAIADAVVAGAELEDLLVAIATSPAFRVRRPDALEIDHG